MYLKRRRRDKLGRPMKLSSRTCVQKVKCCDLIITISFHEKTNTPYECFIKAAKKDAEKGKSKKPAGGCHANQSAIAELTTYLLKNNLLNEAVDALEHIRCIACRKDIDRAKKEDKPTLAWSCPDAVARVLKDWIEEENGKKKDTK
jgi:hypothetical protein